MEPFLQFRSIAKCPPTPQFLHRHSVVHCALWPQLPPCCPLQEGVRQKGLAFCPEANPSEGKDTFAIATVTYATAAWVQVRCLPLAAPPPSLHSPEPVHFISQIMNLLGT